MAIGPRLDQRQSQSLVMTPQLQQAIKMLQLSNIELVEYVEHELQSNPLLEHEDDRADGLDLDTGLAPAEESVDGLESMDFERPEDPADSGENQLDVDYDNVWNSDDGGAGPQAGLGEAAFASYTGGGGFDGPIPTLEQTVAGETSLRDHLMEQISLELSDPAARMIGAYMADLLDDAGYLPQPLDAIADTLGCGLADVERTLEKLQAMDPTGIFARSLAECLALQLRERNRLDPAMQALLDNLELLAKRDMAGLIKCCGVDADDIAEMAAEIRQLNPKPASAFDHLVAHPIIPDVLMRAQPGGGWIIELNQDSLPRVLVNNSYYTRIAKSANRKEDRQYINDCLQSANWLVKSLHQRATTILRVATELVRQQDGFFRHGVHALKPLVLRDIADEIEMHESTVSRVTSNKYMMTPRGIFELKYFFTTAIANSTGGAAHSAESVRHRIKDMIDAEDPKKVLSDDKLVNILTAQGIDIARRTVAKYRESLGLGSSVQRRREKSSTL